MAASSFDLTPIIIEKGELNVATIAKTALIAKKEPIPEVAVTDVTTTNSTPQVSKPAPAKKMGGWGRFKAAAGDGGGGSSSAANTAAAVPASAATVASSKSEGTQPPPSQISSKSAKREENTGEKSATEQSSVPKKDDTSSTLLKSSEYVAINDRLNRIENLISDFMIKLDDKTRSIEKSVAKSRSSKSKHAKPHSVTICVDSAGNQQQGLDSNCDEQYL